MTVPDRLPAVIRVRVLLPAWRAPSIRTTRCVLQRFVHQGLCMTVNEIRYRGHPRILPYEQQQRSPGRTVHGHLDGPHVVI